MGGAEEAEKVVRDASELDAGDAIALFNGGCGDSDADCLDEDAPESGPVTEGGTEDPGASGQMSGIFSILSCANLAVCWTLSSSSGEGCGGNCKIIENK
jgi:hypothetical protein